MAEPKIFESENPIQIAEISDVKGIIFDCKFTNDLRIRKVILDKIIDAVDLIPEGLNFKIYEAYRSPKRQREMWNQQYNILKKNNPDLDEHELITKCEVLIANPYKVGSGHQFGCAVDITLCNCSGQDINMGGKVQEFNDFIRTDCTRIDIEAQMNRKILKNSLESTGLINYPEEWWHYSYGDRLWAILTCRDETLYAPLKFE